MTPVVATPTTTGRTTLAPGDAISFRGATHRIARGRTLHDEGRRVEGEITIETVHAEAITAATERTGRHPALLRRDADTSGEVYRVLAVEEIEPGRARIEAERIRNRSSLGDELAGAVGL